MIWFPVFIEHKVIIYGKPNPTTKISKLSFNEVKKEKVNIGWEHKKGKEKGNSWKKISIDEILKFKILYSASFVDSWNV